jgi:dipeptidyl aminopeptidase/acylaminoacyl peptidase
MKSCIAALTAAVAVGMAASALAEPPPASAFGRLPMVQQASLSPDGKRVAILGGPAEDRRVSIATIDQEAMPTLRLGAVETVDLTWAGNQYVIARMAYWDKETDKVSYRLERNVAIDTGARALGRILDGAVGLSNMTTQPVIGIVDGPSPKAIIEGDGEIWRADVASRRGVVQETGSSSGRTFGWAVDSEGDARVRLDADHETLWVMARPKGVKSWKPIWTGAYVDVPKVYYGYSEPDAAVYLYQEKDGVGQLVRQGLTAGGPTTPFGPPVRDGTFSTIWDSNLHTIVGFSELGDRPVITWTDPEIGATHSALAKLFAGQDVSLESWSGDRQRFVIRTTSPSDPAVWYLFDKSRRELSPLGEEYPELKGFHFGPTRWLKYKARDGIEIAAYLTLPPSYAAGHAKAPLIVLPHGGPGERDGFDFDFMTQFLASRGYAVLRPQFRGSSGFGLAFEKAGRGEWGGKMQTDLIDGVGSLAGSGEVDAKRVCIVGASFGGYAALAGAALNPDAYRCAASFAGISDLGVMLGEEMRAWGPSSSAAEFWRKMLGAAPKSLLDSTSPARMASQVNIPVLLIHGDKDTVVPIEQSQIMVRSLRAAGKPVEMVTLADENHYLAHSATRTQMLEALGAFLAKNLPVQP